jgi:hypothetical protein
MLAAARGHRSIARSLSAALSQGRRAAALAPLLALALMGWPVDPAMAQSTRETVGGAVEDVYDDADYQTEMPPTPAEVATAVERAYDARDYQTEMPQEEPVQRFEPLVVPDIVKEIIRIVLITLLAVGGLLLLFFLVNALPAIRERLRLHAARQDQIGATPIASDADRERLEIALSEADRLARQGAYGEALHLLLLYCLNEMRRRFGLGLPPSLTSREILGLSVLPEIRRLGLSVIVSAVEVSHFGGRPVDETTYQLCRQRCEDVVLGGAAA